MKLYSMNEELNLLKVSVLKIRFQTALRARAVDVINSSSMCCVKVNKMPFTKEDKIVIKMLRQEKGYGAKKFVKEFPDRNWSL